MVSGVLIDIDGVLTVSWRPLPGAAECLRWLREEGVPFQLVTNTSSRSRREIAQILGDAGMPVEAARISTAVSSAADYLTHQHPHARCLVINDGPLDEDLVGVVQTADAKSAGIVLLGGAGPDLGYRDLNVVFKLALDDIPVVALHRNTRYQTDDGPALDMGAFILGLEAAARIEIPVLGKPSEAFFGTALKQIGVRAKEALMVGDDIDADVRGGQAVGITGVLVRTGKFLSADLGTPGPPPDHVIEGIGRLPDLIEGLGLGRSPSVEPSSDRP
jgi:HAD superfamily hydrolase (TIGR01458 family)